ncbi:unnamed protein product [Orchesella dallaii]
MRNTVNQVKVQIINRLVQQIRKYKERKGNEDEKQKANRKADRLVEEIQALKKLKKDKASLYALLDTQKLEDVLGNPSASSEEKAVARLSHHPLIQKDVKKYRNSNPNWDVQISVLLEMTKQKKPKKDEPTTTFPNNVISDVANAVKTNEEIKSEVDEDLAIKTESQSDSQSNESSDDSDEADETPAVKSKPTKQTLSAPKVDSGSKKLIIQRKPTMPLCDKSTGTVKVKFLKDLAELEDSTETFTASSGTLRVDVTKAPVIKRPKSAFFVGGIDEPKEESPQDFQQKPTFTRNPNAPSKPVFRKGKLISKPPPRQPQSSNFNQKRQGPPPKFGRPDNRFSGNSEPLEQNPKRSKFSNDSDRNLKGRRLLLMTTIKMDANCIARSAIEQFNKLPKKGKPNPTTEWTSLATILQEEISSDDKNNSVSKTKIVALGTGTKCLGKNELSKLGDVVSDSHAEVVARRSFLLYLYEQIDLIILGKRDKSILEYINENNEKNSSLLKNFKLRKNISFHMFISHLPCGDAAIVESDDEPKGNEDACPPSKKSKLDDSSNEHRTGAKLQVGPLQYEETQVVGKCRVKPGKGDPTLCMSCSDKLAKWQIMGLQGALLSVFIPEPIRIKSITIGGNIPFRQESLERALYARFSEQVSSILNESFPEYVVGYQCPLVYQTELNFMEFKETLVPAPASISWYSSVSVLDPKEIVQVLVNGRKQGATKKFFGKPSSMVDICRAKIFAKYDRLYRSQLSNIEGFAKSYGEAKNASANYVAAWGALKQSVFVGWTDKPSELKMFTI